MSLIWQEYYAGTMRAQGFKFKYSLTDYNEADGEEDILAGPFDSVEDLMKYTDEHPEYKRKMMSGAWYNDKGEVMG